MCSFLRLGASALGFYIGGEAGAEAVASFVNDKKDAAIPNRKHITAECVMEIEEMKAAMQKAIRSICEGERTNAKKIIIFVDDLDRLEPKNAVELLEGIKNFVDCENCVFVLALDQKVVFEGVKEKYGEELGAVMAKKFFDKIIQVPFTLPVVRNRRAFRQWGKGDRERRDNGRDRTDRACIARYRFRSQRVAVHQRIGNIVASRAPLPPFCSRPRRREGGRRHSQQA